MSRILAVQPAPSTTTRIRDLLAARDLGGVWTDAGPTFAAFAWLACDHRPAELTEAQWDALLLAWAIWSAEVTIRRRAIAASLLSRRPSAPLRSTVAQ